MPPKFVALIATLISWCLFVQIHSEMYPIAVKKDGAKYCGSFLSDILADVCAGKHNTPTSKKSYEGDSDEDYGYLDDTRLVFPYRTRSNAASLLPGRFRRVSRGIVEECCRKPCTIKELSTYCSA